MKVLVVLSALVTFAAAAALSPTELDMLDAFDYDTLLANDEQAKIVLNCMLEKGECGALKQVAELSMKLIINQCAECSPTQMTRFDYVLKNIHDRYEPFYNELMKKVAAKKE